MDWISGLFEGYGGTVLSVLAGSVLVIVIVAACDGRMSKSSPSQQDKFRHDRD